MALTSVSSPALQLPGSELIVKQWKVFSFFDVTQVSLQDSNIFDVNPLPTRSIKKEGPPDLTKGSTLASIASGSESLFLGTQDGRVHIMSSAFKVVRTFTAYEPGTGSVTHLKQLKGTLLLVTIAEDLSSDPVLKVWALDKIEKKTNAPQCLSTLSIQNGRRQFPISAFAALEDLSQLAVGFGNGSVTVVRGDLIHDRGARQRTVFESEEPITGVEFREGANTTLYLATTGRILTLTISGRGQGQHPKTLEDMGCGVGCMTADREAGEMVVVRNDRIYYYGVHGRGRSYPCEGPKQLVRTFRQYLAIVSPPQAPTSRTGPLRLFGSRQPDDMFNTSTFAVLDTDFKYVAHTETLTSQVRDVLVEWGDMFVLTVDGKIFRYHEKPMQQKLDMLFQRDLYPLAIEFAQKANLDVKQRNVILKKFGDHLYRKGDYDTAMQQYLKAIDNIEPSQVIRKFLDTQRIHNLIEYLEELHDHDRATVDHTTLLLNCYAKLKDTEKLENFINSGTNFDFDTAIVMCRQGGYFDQAVFLAHKHKEHSIVIDVLIEDSQKYQDALKYIWRLEAEVAYPNMMKYARVLLEHCPKDTTKIFIDYYTGRYRPKDEQQLAVALTPQMGVSGIASLASFIPRVYRQQSQGPPSGGQTPQPDESRVLEVDGEDPRLNYQVPRPRTAFSSFVDHPREFIVFLEACIRQHSLEESDKTDLYTTLFEMYLDAASHENGSEKARWEAAARELVDSKQMPIDASNVLLLSHLSSYQDGTMLVRERQGLRFDIFRSYTSAKDTAGAINALRKYGPEEPGLYPAALAYFTSSEKILEEAGDEVDAVLAKIEKDKLMAPLQVVQTLSANDVAKLGIVKTYLGDIITRERKDIENNRRLALSYRTSTTSKRNEIATLASKPTVFQSRRCSFCSKSLDLPTVHFLCKHSFHQRCLNLPSQSKLGSRSQLRSPRPAIRPSPAQSDDDMMSDQAEPQCPICEKDNETLKAMRNMQIETAEKHDLFIDALKRSQDKLGTVGEFFGRGVMATSEESRDV